MRNRVSYVNCNELSSIILECLIYIYITLYNTLRITHVLYFYGGIQCFGNAFIIIIFQTRNRICEVQFFLIEN